MKPNRALGVDNTLHTTALGTSAFNTGNYNTASGAYALDFNSTGSYNTAGGSGALENNTTGSNNTASGAYALSENTTGNYNTAGGSAAMNLNATGANNTAYGYFALAGSNGSANTAIGANALAPNAFGSNNIAIGANSGSKLSTGSNNIHIGSLGSAADSGTIRIGGSTALGDPVTQTSFFGSGIRGVTTGSNDAIPVVIDSNNQLGTISSSRRFKEEIQDMGDASRGLMRLRPVTFRYKNPFADGSKPIQYGLIAEEVAEVYPDLVAHSADGQVESVKYQVLDSLLLNEMQRQQAEISSQRGEISAQREQISKQAEQIGTQAGQIRDLQADQGTQSGADIALAAVNATIPNHN